MTLNPGKGIVNKPPPPAQVVQGQVVQGGTTQGLPPNFPLTKSVAGTSMNQIMKTLFLVMETIYSCQSCGGMCQIKEDMKTDGQVVLTRLQDDDDGVVKRCPYCNTTATFYKVTRGLT